MKSIRMSDGKRQRYLDNDRPNPKLNASPLIVEFPSKYSSLIDQLLPDNCLMEIFLKLSHPDKLQVEQVSKRWRQLALQSWRNVEKMRIASGQKKGELIAYLKRAWPFLKEIQFDDYERDFLISAKSYFANVETLIINDLNEESQAGKFDCWRDIFREFKALKCFSLNVSNKSLYYDVMSLLPRCVEEISLLSEMRVSDPMHPQNFSRLQNLRQLCISSFNFDYNCLRGLEYLYNLKDLLLEEGNNYSNIMKSLRNSTRLYSLEIPASKITKVALHMLIKNNPGLAILDISECFDVTDDMLEIISTLPNLQYLIMRHIYGVKLLYVKPMPKLRHLDCYGCLDISPQAVIEIIKSSPLLETLNVRGMQNTLPEFYDSVISIIQSRESGPELKLLANPEILDGLQDSLDN